MDKNLHKTFISLVRLGIGRKEPFPQTSSDWQSLQDLAISQGLYSIVLDGIELLPDSNKPPKTLLLEWISLVMQDEIKYVAQHKSAVEMALLFHDNYIRTFVLKGEVLSECYPKPEHRVSSDMDCFLLPNQGSFDAWNLGNDIIKTSGFAVDTSFYKNSTFYLPGLTVENHHYMVPFRGNKRLKMLEIMLQNLLYEDNGKSRFKGTYLYRPPVMVSALFLIEHAYSHFLHEGLTWRHVLDWMMFSRKNEGDINWQEFEALVDEYGLRKFYDSYGKLGKYLLGEIEETDLDSKDKRMLNDVWADLDLHETLHGVKGKLALVGNTLRAQWKYRDFSEITMIQALWIQVKGFLFDKHPSLE